MASVQVRLSSTLWQFTGELSSISVTAENVETVMTELFKQFPDLKPSIYSERGQIKSFCRVFKNTKDITDESFISIRVEDGDEIQLIRALSGG